MGAQDRHPGSWEPSLVSPTFRFEQGQVTSTSPNVSTVTATAMPLHLLRASSTPGPPEWEEGCDCIDSGPTCGQITMRHSRGGHSARFYHPLLSDYMLSRGKGGGVVAFSLLGALAEMVRWNYGNRESLGTKCRRQSSLTERCHNVLQLAYFYRETQTHYYFTTPPRIPCISL